MDYYIAFLHKNKQQNDLIIYITDAFKAICDNTSKPYGGTTLNKRFYEILVPDNQKNEKEKEEEPDEVINRFKKGLEKVAKWTYST